MEITCSDIVSSIDLSADLILCHNLDSTLREKFLIIIPSSLKHPNGRLQFQFRKLAAC
jgi:hypothetical protein